MTNSLSRETNTITIATFWENHQLKKYNYDPAYQRQSVWSEEKQSFFIDSILKNFPIPPIFLHQKIDDETGKTTYDVIDGKQRLTSIICFLKNEIPVTDESSTSPFYDKKIAGVFFKDLDKKELQDYKKKLWRYTIPIEYIDTSDRKVIDNIFDRLNRNGEPLEGQELRKSKYHSTKLLFLVEKLAQNSFWKERLQHTDVSRMEHYEFISELLFQQIKGEALAGSPDDVIDKLYEDYSQSTEDWLKIEENFLKITEYMDNLEIDYKQHKVGGVSHLYGIWCLAQFCVCNQIESKTINNQLSTFFSELRTNNSNNNVVEEYRKSMASRTKSEGQRRNRFEALKKYLKL